jgi:hypothetical protein
MFGKRLSAASIRLVPIHGTNSLPALAESGILSSLGLPLASLTDNTDPGWLTRGVRLSGEEQDVFRFLSEMRRQGIQITPLGTTARDILSYLDQEVCQEFAPDFPGWGRAARDWSHSSERESVSFKQWVLVQYGLHLDRDAVAKIAKRCTQLDRIPLELTQIVTAMESLASSGRSRIRDRCDLSPE